MTRCLNYTHLSEENKNTKPPPELPVENTTINTTGVDHKTPGSEKTEHCGICKSSKRHKLQECPAIKKCEHMAVRRHYAASCGFFLTVALKDPGTVLPHVRTLQHVQYVPDATFLFCTSKVIMVVDGSSHRIIKGPVMLSLTRR